MKAKWVSFLGEVVVLTMILLTGVQPLAAAPKEELKTAAQYFGAEVPLPRLQSTAANDFMLLLYDNLVGTTPDMKLSTETGLANKWEMTPDGRTWTFYLRKGVKFHDGVELTAKDVKFSIEQMMLPDARSTNASLLKQTIKSMEVKDPYTLVFQCNTSFPFLAYFLSDNEGLENAIIPKDYYERVGQDQFIKRPIGSGPYKWHSQVLGSYIKLESSGLKHWRDGVPKYKYMTYLIIPEASTRVAMIKMGDVDITMVGRESVKEVLDAGLKVIQKKGTGFLCFYPNMQWTSPAFSDIRFRKALNLAIDKEAIIKHLLEGMGTSVATLPGSAAMSCGGDPALKPYPYDPEEAKRLIKEGGYEGTEFSIPVFDRAECPELPKVAETVVGYWHKIGLKPKIFMTEWVTWMDKWNARKTENTIMGVDSSVVPGCNGVLRTYEQKLHSKSKRTHVMIPYLDERFKTIFSSVNPTEVERLTGEIYHYMYDNYLVVPICELSNMIAITKQTPTWDPGFRRRDLNYRELIRQQ